jgi:CRP/FNR family transcriptional regulator, transcriptional activator FtrB
VRATERGELRRLRLFASVAADHLPDLLDGAPVVELSEQMERFREGGAAQFLHVLLDGIVELFAQLDQKETTITILRSPSAFLLATVVGDDDAYPISARTLSASRILLVPATAVRNAFDRDTEFARAVTRELYDAFNSTLIGLVNQKLRSSLERVADWLLHADAQSGDHRFTLPFDKRTLASQLGMTPEHLSRNLKCLSRHGVVVAGRKVVVDDWGALATVARQNRNRVIEQ